MLLPATWKITQNMKRLLLNWALHPSDTPPENCMSVSGEVGFPIEMGELTLDNHNK